MVTFSWPRPSGTRCVTTCGCPSRFVGLSVVLGDRTVLEGLQLNGFAPRSSWQLAVAASSADDLEGTDEHSINDLRVVSSTLLERADVPVRVSLNGQQLHPPLHACAHYSALHACAPWYEHPIALPRHTLHACAHYSALHAGAPWYEHPIALPRRCFEHRR